MLPTSAPSKPPYRDKCPIASALWRRHRSLIAYGCGRAERMGRAGPPHGARCPARGRSRCAGKRGANAIIAAAPVRMRPVRQSLRDKRRVVHARNPRARPARLLQFQGLRQRVRNVRLRCSHEDEGPPHRPPSAQPSLRCHVPCREYTVRARCPAAAAATHNDANRRLQATDRAETRHNHNPHLAKTDISAPEAKTPPPVAQSSVQ